MVLHEFLPLLARHRLHVDRPAVLGYSMGGFGALLCGLAAPGRFASIIASSPAFWRSYDEAEHVNPEAFASASDWHRYGDLLSQAAAVSRLPAQIYVGAADSFTPAIRTLQDRLADPDVVHVAKGCHDNSYWRSLAPAQLRLVGAALASI
jgi:enterochelin esterase-like enzyme